MFHLIRWLDYDTVVHRIDDGTAALPGNDCVARDKLIFRRQLHDDDLTLG